MADDTPTRAQEIGAAQTPGCDGGPDVTCDPCTHAACQVLCDC